MKKIFLSFLISVVALIPFTSCDNNDDELMTAQTITIVSRDTNFPAAASTGSVKFQADGAVTVSTDNSWITATVEGDMIMITCAENPNIMSRTGVITARCNAGTTDINIYQEGVLFDIPDKSGLTFKSYNSSRDIKVTSNVTVQVLSSYDWISGSYADGIVKISVDENRSFDERKGEVVLKYGDRKLALPITQLGFDLDIFNMTEWNCPDTRKTMTVELPFECDIDFQTSNPDWLVSSYNRSTRKWTITAVANNTGHIRTGSFTYTIGNRTGSVKVTQCTFSKDLAGNDYRLYFTNYDNDRKQDVRLYFEAQVKKVGSNYRISIPKINLNIPVEFDTDTYKFTLRGGQFCGTIDKFRVYTVFDFEDNGTYLTWSKDWSMVATPVYNDANGETTLNFVDSGENPHVITTFELHAFSSSSLSVDNMCGTILLLRDMLIVKSASGASTASMAEVPTFQY